MIERKDAETILGYSGALAGLNLSSLKILYSGNCRTGSVHNKVMTQPRICRRRIRRLQHVQANAGDFFQPLSPAGVLALRPKLLL